MLKTKRKKPLRIKTPVGVVVVEYLGRDGSEKQYGLVLPPGCELEKEEKCACGKVADATGFCDDCFGG